MGKKYNVLGDFGPFLLQLFLLGLAWLLLWKTEMGQNSLASAIRNSYLRVLILLFTVAYAIVTSCLLNRLYKKYSSKAGSSEIHPGLLQMLKKIAHLPGYMVFSVVWIAIFKVYASQSNAGLERWLEEPFRFYMLACISAVFFFPLEQIASSLKSSLEEKYKSRIAGATEKNILREIFVVSYILLLLLVFFTNGLIPNIWLLLLSLIILQLLFPFVMTFCPRHKLSNNDETDYKKWLVNESSEWYSSQ